MSTLHPDVLKTLKEVTIKESEGFRLRMEKWEAISPKGLFSVNLIQESLNEDGEVWNSSTYNFNMTKEEIRALTDCLNV